MLPNRSAIPITPFGAKGGDVTGNYDEKYLLIMLTILNKS